MKRQGAVIKPSLLVISVWTCSVLSWMASCANSTTGTQDVGVVDSGPEQDAQPVDGGGGPADAAQVLDAAPMQDAGGGSGIGAPCESPDDCNVASGLVPQCVTGQADVDFPGGYCSAECTPPDGGEDPCGDGAACVQNLNGSANCVKLCTDSSECRVDEGYECQDPMNMLGQTICFPVL